MTRKKRNNRRVSNEALLLVFSRLPTRDAKGCSARSRHHRRLFGSPALWIQRHSLVPAVPRPRIAYMATSVLPGGLFHEFHIAGECPGGGGSDGDLMRLRRRLINREPHYSIRPKYAGTCNGVVALAAGSFYASTTVVLFNPAFSDREVVAGVEVNHAHYLPLGAPGRLHRVSGFGYGPSSRRHMVLLAKLGEEVIDGEGYNAMELSAYTLGPASTDQPRCRKVLSMPGGGVKISGSPVYLDGKIYLLADHSRVLAFDVDDDAVAEIELPGERVPSERHAKSDLMEMSGRLCVATAAGEGSIALWLLTADQQWEQRCLLSRYANDKLAGAWDCGGVLLLFFEGSAPKKEPDLILYDTRTTKAAAEPLNVPRVVAEAEHRQSTTHVFCWGYRPTLVSPGIISGGGGGRPPLQERGGVVGILNPVLERDVKTGRERTLDTVCFMDLLHHITRQLPDKSNEVVRECNRSSFSLR